MGGCSFIGLMDNTEERNVADHQGKGKQGERNGQKGAGPSQDRLQIGHSVFLTFQHDVCLARRAIGQLTKVYSWHP